ncbi:electron transfer flavoprotein subunit beta [Peptococcaceae bacterium CEB3]|nr:electron transfer flavoprotein subunit beta [Peptococcaceae bacterium CEB3]
MKIIACYKWVLDEADLKVEAQSRRLLTGRAKSKISEYDRNALECGVQLIDESGGEVIALTAGTGGAKSSLKDALSRGPAEAVFVKDEIMAQSDPAVTAKVLAAAVRHIGEYDLILCGEGSSDEYSEQVGIRLAQLLGIPVVSFVNKVQVADGVLRAERKLDGGIEVVQVQLPAVVTVLPDMNTPRIPSLKQILAAAKKPVKELNLAGLGLDQAQLTAKVRRQTVLGTVMERKGIRFRGEAREVVQQVLTVLNKEGLC